MDDAEKIAELERQLVEALLKVYELEKKVKANSLLRYDMEEILRGLYRECIQLKESEDKPDIDTLLLH
jgi:predicted DNA-binding protein (UPF0278 family)